MEFKMQFFLIAILFLTWASAETNVKKIDEKLDEQINEKLGEKQERNDQIEAREPKGVKFKMEKFNILRTSKPVPIPMTVMKNDQKAKPETVQIAIAHDHVEDDNMEDINLMNINSSDDLIRLGLNPKDSSRLFRIPLSSFKKKLVLLKFKKFLVAPLLFLRGTNTESDTSEQVVPIQQVAPQQPYYHPSIQYAYPPQYYYPQYYPQAYSYPTEYYQQPTIVQAQPQAVPVQNTAVPVTESIPVAEIQNIPTQPEANPSIVLEDMRNSAKGIKYVIDDTIVSDDIDQDVKSTLAEDEEDEDEDDGIPEIVEVEPESERQASPYVVYQVPQPVKYLRLPPPIQKKNQHKNIPKLNRRQYGSIF